MAMSDFFTLAIKTLPYRNPLILKISYEKLAQLE
jgi:hypothetical protein